ncbi:hypothetical protein OEZ86_002966 [Tetradesmus obliquus]|nr:hypothetical protein OEZ86_002966 [Tetradesmus obliquus]
MPQLFDIRKLVKERPKTPAEVLSKACAALEALEQLGRERGEKEEATVRKNLGYLKFWLFGDEQGHDPTREGVLALAQEVVRTDFVLKLVGNIGLLDFETRKDAAQVFGALVRIKEDAAERSPGAIYVERHPQILRLLFQGYDDPAIALNCGSMYRDCIRDETLATMELYGEDLMEFFQRVEVANFEIASDAFSSFKDLLTRHKQVVAQFLQDNFTRFFDAFAALLQSNNYVTRRQSLKLLGELLLDRCNVRLMMRYVSDVKNLMQMMLLLKDSSRNIQFEAFHVFKVFVANPNKPQAIVDILTNNREKLLKYLEDFHTDRDEDEQFKEEKAVIIREISLLGREQQQQQQPPAAGTPAQQQQEQQEQQQPALAAPQQQQQPGDLAPQAAAAAAGHQEGPSAAAAGSAPAAAGSNEGVS